MKVRALVVVALLLAGAAVAVYALAPARVTVCHKPDKDAAHTITVASSAVPAHLAHGDQLGACPASGSR